MSELGKTNPKALYTMLAEAEAAVARHAAREATELSTGLAEAVGMSRLYALDRVCYIANERSRIFTEMANKL